MSMSTCTCFVLSGCIYVLVALIVIVESIGYIADFRLKMLIQDFSI